MSGSVLPSADQPGELPPELLELQEILAENVHDAWARQRMAEGWVLGATRDDQARTHPGLVAYDLLSESEKQYDRKTAVTTIRTLLARGYRIVPPVSQLPVGTSTTEISRELASLRELVHASDSDGLRSLLTCWRALPAADRWQDLGLARQFMDRLLEFNEPLVAFDCITEGLEFWPDDLRLKQLQGVSLARSGAARKANQVFCKLLDAGYRDEETLANLARTHKTLWQEARAPEEKQLHLTSAYEAYLDSYRVTRGTWSGINVAFLALMRGDQRMACEVAGQVQRQCLEELETTQDSIGDQYWILATLGEAELIQGRRDEARDWYTKASAVAGHRYGNIATTRQQAKQIIKHLRFDWIPFVDCFPLPQVVLCVTARDTCSLDIPYPAEAQSSLAAIIRAELAVRQPVLGFGCLRNWLDLLFLEGVLQSGGEAAVLLDEGEYDCKREATEFRQRADQVLRNCCEVHRLTERASSATIPGDDYIARILVGLANMQARQLGITPTALKLPQPDSAARARSETEFLPPLTSSTTAVTAAHAASILGTLPRLMSLLFADVRGYSRLSETQLLVFSQEFLGRVAALVDVSPVRPVTRHTWGDGLFFTFERVCDAGAFALDLAELIDRMDWRGVGLPFDLSIRIGLHCGPVYECFDPISRQTTFCGVHVNHAARIEPITPPGNVYASEAFAALATAEEARGFVCEYVGRTPLAKDYGLFSTYHVRRGSAEQS